MWSHHFCSQVPFNHSDLPDYFIVNCQFIIVVAYENLFYLQVEENSPPKGQGNILASPRYRGQNMASYLVTVPQDTAR